MTTSTPHQTHPLASHSTAAEIPAPAPSPDRWPRLLESLSPGTLALGACLGMPMTRFFHAAMGGERRRTRGRRPGSPRWS